MTKKRCYIAGAGEFNGGLLPERGDIVIAADGGYAELASRGIMPDFIIGDFDSLKSIPEHPNILRSPAEKDDTDLMLAVGHGFSHGCDTFTINGGLGGRLDHTLANLQILAYIAQNGARGYLAGSDICVTAITAGTVSFHTGTEGYISVFCHGDRAEGVCLRGLKYPLNDAALTCVHPLGVSNEFTGEPASVTVASGTLIVTWECGLEYLEN